MRINRFVFLLLVIWPQCPSLFGKTPEEANLAIHHQAWTFKDGAPDNIMSLTQTNEGFLWLGTETGLFRFDGLKFERFRSPFGDQLLSTNIMSVFAPASGGLWIGYTFGGISFVNHGKVTNYGDERLVSGGSVWAFAQNREGTLWAATSARGLLRFENSLWQPVDESWKLPVEEVTQLGFDRDGTLWLMGENKDVAFQNQSSPAIIYIFTARENRSVKARDANT